MTNVLRIPDKFETVEIISGIDFEIDTKGLCCEVCPRGGSIMVMLPGQNGRILVKEDEKFDFCGRLFTGTQAAMFLSTVSIIIRFNSQSRPPKTDGCLRKERLF